MKISERGLIYSIFCLLFILSIFSGGENAIFAIGAELVTLLGIFVLIDSITKHKIFHIKVDRFLLVMFLLQLVYMTIGYKYFSMYPHKTYTFILRHITMLPFLICIMDKELLVKLVTLCTRYILLIDLVYLVMWFTKGNNGSFLNSYQHVAAYSSVLVTLHFAKLFGGMRLKRKDIIEILIGLFVLLMTGKRSYVLVILLIFIVGLIFLNNNYKSTRIFRVLIPIMMTGAFVMILNPRLLQSLERLSNFSSDVTLSGRTKLWSLALYLWRKNPIFGIGYGTFSTFTSNNLEFTYKNFGVQRNYAAHNIYIQLLTENGLLGCSIFFVFFIVALIKCYIYIRKSKEQSSNSYFLLVVSLFLQLWFLLYGLSGNPLYMSDQFAMYLFAIMIMRSANDFISEIGGKKKTTILGNKY